MQIDDHTLDHERLRAELVENDRVPLMRRLLEILGPLYEQNDPAHDLTHALRVAELAQKIANEEGGDLDVILPAALCHDLRRWETPSHSEENAEFITKLLVRAGYRGGHIGRITKAVQRHSFSAPTPPSTLEEKIVFDADKLEGIGAVGIGRCFTVSGTLNQAIFNSGPDDVTAQRMLSIRLVRCYDRLYTDTARRLGAARRDFLLSFIDQLDSELSLTKHH